MARRWRPGRRPSLSEKRQSLRRRPDSLLALFAHPDDESFRCGGTLALYHIAVPQSLARALEMPHLHAVPDQKITLTADLAPAWEQKLAPIGCHRTQEGGSPILSAPENRRRLFLGKEHFRLAGVRQADPLREWITAIVEG